MLSSGSAGSNRANVTLNDGSAFRDLHKLRNNSDGNPEEPQTVTVKGITFLRTGDSLEIATAGPDAFVHISSWPVADVNGNLINPSGFSFE